MALDLANFEDTARAAVKAFWEIQALGNVRGGKTMDGFRRLMYDIVHANGSPTMSILYDQPISAFTLPGYFRATKNWDLVIIHQDRLVAAIEFKSQVGSFGNNFNNRTEEALGSALDFWEVFQRDGFGRTSAPFLGWLMLLEDAPGSRTPIKESLRVFKTFPEFQNTSYAERYQILCQKLIREKLYTEACLLLSSRDAAELGEYLELDELTGLRNFVTAFAGHIAAAAAR